MLEFIDKINLDEKLKEKVIDLAQKDRVNVLSLADKCNRGNFDCLIGKNDLLKLAVIIECAKGTKNKYEALGIDEEVLFATLDDIRIWCENNGNNGLKNTGWIKNHINAELFKIGRLQFQFFTCNNKLLDYSRFPFDCGEKVIYVHIPQGEKLEYSACLDSLKSSVSFFEKYFPDYHYDYYFCESWLLYDENYQFMKPSSNIMQFSSLFDIVCSFNYDGQAIERIFGKRRINKRKYQENTTLQRDAKAFMLKGGKLGIGVGVIHKTDLL